MPEVLMITLHLPTKVVIIGEDDALASAFSNLFKSEEVSEAMLASSDKELCEVSELRAKLQQSFNKVVQYIPCCSVNFPEPVVTDPPVFFFDSEKDKNWFLRKYLGKNLSNVVESKPVTH